MGINPNFDQCFIKLFLTFFFLFISYFSYGQDIPCRVVGITDGDTLRCLSADKKQVKVRLGQIDAPESNQPFGNRSRQQLSNYVFGKDVVLKSTGTDRYQRTLAEVYFNGQNINMKMVHSGMAWAYKEYMTNPAYERAQTVARQNRVGLWADADPIYPSDWRRSKSKRSTAKSKATTASSGTGQKFTCGSKRTCGQMTSCAEAKFYLNTCGVSRLDRDKDGIPCESICR